jgi:uncharacterized protein (TIGR03382 family)
MSTPDAGPAVRVPATSGKSPLGTDPMSDGVIDGGCSSSGGMPLTLIAVMVGVVLLGRQIRRPRS